MRIFTLLFFCFFISTVQAQDEPEQLIFIENMPVHKGCAKIKSKLEKQKCTEEKVTEFIKKNTVYPKKANAAKLYGYVEVKYIIGEDGLVIKNETEVLAGFSGKDAELYNNEAIRVINRLPALIPASNDDTFYKVMYTQRVHFD